MCGIIGIASNKKNAAHVLLSGLKSLEYRGYDSAGIAINVNDKIKILKSEGNISNLEIKISQDKNIESSIGVGHTRWATHGSPNETNSHPHRVGKITLVHNGIIENYLEIKEYLIEKGYSFISDTDTEVAAALIDYYYNKTNDIVSSLEYFKKDIRGSYALGIVIDDSKDNIIAMRKDSPLIVGRGTTENYIASDETALLEHTKLFATLEDGDIALISNDKIEFFNNGSKIKKDFIESKLDVESAKKGAYPHFMLKEIFDQPQVLKGLVEHYAGYSPGKFINKFKELKLNDINKIHAIACGSASYTSEIVKHIFAKFGVELNPYLASEYRYGKIFNDEKTLALFISQSGTTADTIAALRRLKDEGVSKTLGIVNVVGSTIAKEVNNVLYINAGKEIAVATTKAFTAQLITLIYLALAKACIDNKLRFEELEKILVESKKIPSTLEKLLQNNNVKNIADKIYNWDNMFFIGRQVDHAINIEGSLKLKEVSYVHSEAYAAGELKHGTISLVTEGTPVFATITDENILDKTVSNMKEVKARGANVILYTTKNLVEKIPEDSYDEIILSPKVNEYFQSLLLIPLMQLMGYEIAFKRGEEIDKPRNLAKSVTVE